MSPESAHIARASSRLLRHALTPARLTTGRVGAFPVILRGESQRVCGGEA